MRKILIALLFFIICFVIFLFVGLNIEKNLKQQTEAIPTLKVTKEKIPGIVTPEEVFPNSTSDIFLFRGIIYTNASDIEWVNERDINIGKLVGEITKVDEKGSTIEGVVSTKLPVGTKIFEPIGATDEILKLNNKEIRFLGLVEG